MKSHIIYVNAQIKDDTALGQLMHDFPCTDAEQMHYQILANRVRYFKEDTEGVVTMCKVMEDMRNEAAREKALSIARRVLELGKLSYEEIADSFGLTVDEVRLWTRVGRPDTVSLRLNQGSCDYVQGNGRYEKRSCA